MRITVQEILRWLGASPIEEEILSEYPYLDEVDFSGLYLPMQPSLLITDRLRLRAKAGSGHP